MLKKACKTNLSVAQSAVKPARQNATLAEVSADATINLADTLTPTGCSETDSLFFCPIFLNLFFGQVLICCIPAIELPEIFLD